MRTSVALLTVSLLTVGVTQTSASDSLLVDVTGGRIVGAVEKSASGREFYAYRAVPYASFAPGESRLHYADDVIPWTEVLDCRSPGPVCAQGAFDTIVGEEDCLHLSVYTTQKPGSKSAVPVLVWLHGGLFISSGASDYDPRFMMDQDIVLVVPQYRLGFLGFFYGFSDAPGNYGMMDQVKALRWVQDNIAQFGGDPNRVTLGGDCSGGASALYHMLSPLSQGLFHGVISDSGSPLSLWALHTKHRRLLLILAQYLKCPHAPGVMTDCFRDMPLEQLMEAQMNLLESYDPIVGNARLAPVVQTQVKKDQANQFLSEEPLVLFAEGRFSKVPVLIITSKDVGNYLVDTALYDVLKDKQEEQKDKFKADKNSIMKQLRLPHEANQQKEIFDYYLPEFDTAEIDEMLSELALFLGDAMYNVATVNTVKYLHDRVHASVLRFDYIDGPHSFHSRHPDPSIAPPLPVGADHVDELQYFLPSNISVLTTDSQLSVSRTMVNIINEFVHQSPSSYAWPPQPVTEDGLIQCGVITREGEFATDALVPQERIKLMDKIFQSQNEQALSILKINQKKVKDEL